MNIALKILMRPGFAEAFKKLCAEPLTPAEKFRLAKCKREIEDALEHEREVRGGLIKKHGIPEDQYLERCIGQLSADVPEQAQLRAVFQKRLTDYRTNKEEAWRVDPTDAAKNKAYRDEEKALHAEEVTLALAAPLKLGPGTKLDANDLAELLELIDTHA